MEGAEIMSGDIELVTDILAYEDAMRRREISQMYKEISLLQQKLKYLNTDQSAIERRRTTSRRFGFSTRWEEQVDQDSSSSSSDSEETEYDFEDFFSKDVVVKALPTAAPTAAPSNKPLLQKINNNSGSRGNLVHGLNRDVGIYYCKHCENSWPCSFFRNTQQFGAHCSNCSRQRKVKHPHDLNSEAPKPRSPTPMDLSKSGSPKRTLKNKPGKQRETQKKRKRATKKESSVSPATPAASRKPKHGCDKERGIYYCKHCESSWPIDYFRNPQQFGAHCSNCSRQRQVRDPRIAGESPKPAKSHKRKQFHTNDSDSQPADSFMSEGATSEVYSDGAAPLSAINPFVDDLFGDSALFH